MASENSKTIPTIDHKPHVAFFRQSGWLMIATVIAGIMSWAVHLLNKKISPDEYGIFGTMLMVTACIPVMPIQMLFAQQTAGALVTDRKGQLAGIIRLGWLWTFILWMVAAGVVLLFQKQIAERWQLNSLDVLWVTLVALLMNLWMPLFAGVLQGRQDFFWLGHGAIVSGFGRLAVPVLIVLAFHGGATGMMFGALAGLGAWAAIGMWRSRDLWSIRPEKFDGRGLFRQAAPLMLGFGAVQFFLSADTMFTKAFFSGDEMAPYVAAGTLSRGLQWLVLPLAAVMFPKIVHASAKSEKNNLLKIVFIATAALTICGTAGLCVFGPSVVKLVYSPEYVAATMKLLPWYAGAMIPLTLSNVLMNDLMARSKFKIVPLIALLAVVYGFTLPFMLHKFPGHMEVALQTLGAFTLVLLAICAWFSFGKK